jgi:hypothetical protein
LRILDALHIHERGDDNSSEASGDLPGPDPNPASPRPSRLQIVWSRDWVKCALIIDGYVHALFDFAAHGGYNINEFPPPNAIWTNGDRKLTDELIRHSF